MNIATPYYLIDEQRMLPAMLKIKEVFERSGAKSVLALKCFSAWCAFDFMRHYLAGTTSSSLYEAKLGRETFGGENHGYSVAYNEAELREVVTVCDKVIFNSLSQLHRFKKHCGQVSVGVRCNPKVGYSEHALSDTVCEYSRLGVSADQIDDTVLALIDGVMFHTNCDNDDFDNFATQLAIIEQRFGSILKQLRWVSLGGGIAFTSKHYPLQDFSRCLKAFSDKYSLQVYLEPGEAAVTESSALVVSVLDIVNYGLPTLIVDAGVETHLLDAMVYDYTPSLQGAVALAENEVALALKQGKNVYRVAGRTCLSGDVFGHYVFSNPVAIGHRLTFDNVGGYSMVKKNFFNGIAMPSVCHKSLSGETRIVRQFSYHDFKRALS